MTVDIVDTKPGRGRVEIRTGVGRKRRWSDEERGRIVAEAVMPGAVVSDVARRHDMSPQHLFRWIKAAKEGKFALPADAGPACGALAETSFVPVVVEPAEAPKPAVCRERTAAIEIAIGAIKVRVRNDADTRTIEAVLLAVKRVAA
ncbi:MAG: transposase [Alphaproteobacteria bacterium]|nr:transposase [Alphaproteobacteria bacterium]